MTETRLPRTGVITYSDGTDSLSRADWNEQATGLEARTVVYLQGNREDRPAAGQAGRFFRALNTGELFWDTGSQWVNAVATTDTVRTSGVRVAGDVWASRYRMGAQDASTDVPAMSADGYTSVVFVNEGAALFCDLKARSFLTQSSRRYKENIRATRHGLDDVLAVPVVDFHYKAGHGYNPDERRTGFIAEDIEGPLPMAVAYGSDGQVDAVDTPALIPILWRGVQELTERVRWLEERLS